MTGISMTARGKDRGFTLIELAFSVFIVGTLMASSLAVGQFIKGQKVKETRQKIDYISNVLSAYAQTHYRLPCPADPGTAVLTERGREMGGGKCLNTTSASAMYWDTEGVVPWKELGIPESMVVDSWNHYITYKPAPNLTANMLSAEMQDKPLTGTTDVHNACRSAMWYDTKGRHVNRAKALFCCNAEPKAAYLAAVGQVNPLPAGWRKSGAMDTKTAANTASDAGNMLPDGTPVHITNNWSDPATASYNGTFKTSRYLNGTAAPLLRAVGPAVTLISHGPSGDMAFLPETAKTQRMHATLTSGAGVTGGIVVPDSVKAKSAWPPQMFSAVMNHPKVGEMSNGIDNVTDDIAVVIRTDQIFAKAGGGSCEYPPNVWFQPYKCTPQNFANPGSAVNPGNAYGLQLKLTNGQKYTMHTAFTQHNAEAGYHNSLGFYVIDPTGKIKNVSLIAPDVKNVGTGNTTTSTVGVDTDGDSKVGIFIIPNGAGHKGMNSGNPVNNDFSQMDLGGDNLAFESAPGVPANINDSTPPKLVYTDPLDPTKKTYIKSEDPGGAAYHMDSSLNPGMAGHTLTDDTPLPDGSINNTICQNSGQKVGVNSDITCAKATSIQDVGVNANDPSSMKMGFEDLAFKCYEMKGGGCKKPGDAGYDPAKRIKDNTGGWVTQSGDSDADDVTFSFSMVACPDGT